MKNTSVSKLDRTVPAEAFRVPMEVTEIRRFATGYTYPVCPRCRLTLDREYQHFCDRCGQALDWRKFTFASAATPGKDG